MQIVYTVDKERKSYLASNWNEVEGQGEDQDNNLEGSRKHINVNSYYTHSRESCLCTDRRAVTLFSLYDATKKTKR